MCLQIEKFYLEIVQSERVDLLSDAEFKYVTNFYRNQKTYFVENFLDKLPGKLNDFGTPSKIPKKMRKRAPRVRACVLVVSAKQEYPVFIRITKAISQPIMLYDDYEAVLNKGQIYFLPY